MGDGRAVGAVRRARRPARLPRALVRRLVRRRRLGGGLHGDGARAGRGTARPRVGRGAPRLARASCRRPAARGRGEPRRAALRVLLPAASARTARSARSSSSRAGAQPSTAELLATMASLGRQIGQYLERCRAEKALRDSDARMRAMLDAAFDAIVVMDAEGRIVGVNRAAEQIFGYARGRAGGRTSWPRCSSRPAARAAPARRSALPAHGRGRVVGHPSSCRRCAPTAASSRSRSRSGGSSRPARRVFTGFIRDLTERRRSRARAARARPRSRRRCAAWPRWWRSGGPARACSPPSPRRSAACSAPSRPT